MSVPKSLRGESKLEVFKKSEDLVEYTIRLCSNEKHFPKRIRWCVTSKIVDSAITMYNNLNKANSIYCKTELEFNQRRMYQKLALSETYSMLGMIKLSYKIFSLQTDSVEFWVTNIMEVQKLIRGWIEYDEKRTDLNK